MTILVCGGTIGVKASGVVAEIASKFHADFIYNGILPETISGANLTIWMPDISNDEEKNYPKKDKGSVLICSKVMREGYTDTDAASRIFAMHGNAVIKIYKQNPRLFYFQLMDALGNNWTPVTDDLGEIVNAIFDLYVWTKKSIRKSLVQQDVDPGNNLHPHFVSIIRSAAMKVMVGCKERFFGNYSTRCTKLFPSARFYPIYAMSPRNVDKRFIGCDDRVFCGDGFYYGDRKPSVDAPVQIEIYKTFPHIGCMIHGHAYVKDAITTPDYYPCGDLRELKGIFPLMINGTKIMNLKNHGFLITAEDLDELERYVGMCEFTIPDNKI